MTPYEQGYKDTFDWIEGGKIGDRTVPPHSMSEVQKAEWWEGSNDAFQYFKGFEAGVDITLTRVEDKILYGLCRIVGLVGVASVGYGVSGDISAISVGDVSTLSILGGLIMMVVSFYLSSSLDASIAKRSTTKETRDAARSTD